VAMQINTDVAFKEWAIVVDALGRGEQIFILRKGGIRETRGQFQVDHRQFWLFPTRFHEAEDSVIASKRAALQELAANAPSSEVKIEFLAVADPVLQLTGLEQVQRLQGRHIWSEQILRERFDFGRESGMHALITRVYRLAEPRQFPLVEAYGGCKSWVQLAQTIEADGLEPVLSDTEFERERNEILALL